MNINIADRERGGIMFRSEYEWKWSANTFKYNCYFYRKKQQFFGCKRECVHLRESEVKVKGIYNTIQLFL